MGAGILTFTFGVYGYSIAAVKQDDFSDIPAPSMDKILQMNREKEEEWQQKKDEDDKQKNAASATSVTLPPLGLLGSTGASWVRGKNQSRQIVPGAPPIDRIGRIDDRQVSEQDGKLV
jgi:hypothetical protein